MKQHTGHKSMLMTSCVVIRMIFLIVLWSFCNASFDVWKFEHICIVPVANCCTELNLIENPTRIGFDFRLSTTDVSARHDTSTKSDTKGVGE